MDISFPQSRIKLRGGIIILLIALVAGIGYGGRLGAGDVLSDEALVGFRSLGYLDFLFSQYQTTPLEWFAANPPWWTRVWFHDHPPLAFLLQHFSFTLFGPTAAALRLSSALAAAFAVWCIGLIAKKQWGTGAGIIAALGLAVLTGHVSMARQGLLEAILAALLLASFFSALHARNAHTPSASRPPLSRGDSPPTEGWLRKRGAGVGMGYWYVTAVIWGLAFFTKLTAVALLPVLFYLFWKGRSMIRRGHRVGIVVALSLFIAPLLIYNALLYRATGHFDFQFSYLFHQDVPQWQLRPGREYFPDFSSRLTTFIPHIAEHASRPLNLFAFTALIIAVSAVIRKKSDEVTRAILVTIASFLVLFIITGPLPWFTYLLWPWLILLIARAYSLAQGYMKRRIAAVVVALVLAFEGFVAINTVYAVDPVGQEGLTYLQVWKAHAQWGYEKLEKDLTMRLQGLYPGGTFPVRYPFLERIRAQHIRSAKEKGSHPAKILLVYDTTMQQNALLWIFFRRTVYEGWPVLDVDTYRQIRIQQGNNVFWQQGFEKVIFVRVDPESGILARDDELRTDDGSQLEHELQTRGIDPVYAIISPKTGREALRVYELASN